MTGEPNEMPEGGEGGGRFPWGGWRGEFPGEFPAELPVSIWRDRVSPVLLAEVLARTGVRRESIAAWILHPGGREVLLALQEKMGLSEHDLRWSAGILRDYGNLSSPSVLFVLEAALADTVPNGLWWMSSFGAGFSCHGALLEVTAA